MELLDLGMLLWFDEVSSSTSMPMGSEIVTSVNPVFVVKAVGSFKQLPGCPEFTIDGMSGDRIENYVRVSAIILHRKDIR